MQATIFEWTIKNFSMCTQLSEEYIASPDFFIDAFGTKINFLLCPRGNGQSDKYVSLSVIKRNERDYDQFYEDKCLAIQVSILGDDVKENVLLRQMVLSFNKTVCLQCPDLIEMGIISLNELEGGVKLRIDIVPSKKTGPPDIWSCDFIDLLQLSSNISKGLKGNHHSDAVLKGSGDESFKIHKIILFSRYPNLANMLRVLEPGSTEFKVDIDSLTLKVLLKYLYSGELEQANVTTGLFNLLIHNELDHLHQTLYPVPEWVQLTTIIRVRRGDFHWLIPTFSTLPNNVLLFYDFSCDAFLKWTKLRFKLSFKENDRNELSVALSVQRAYPIKTLCIRFKISFLGENNFEKNYVGLLTESSELDISDIVEKKFLLENRNSFLKNDSLHIVIDVLLSNGKYTSELRNVRLQDAPVTHNSISANKWALQQNLFLLYKDPVFSDVTISVKGEIFQAHKVILSARSPVFYKMFEDSSLEEEEGKPVSLEEERTPVSLEEEKKTVIINDFEASVVKAMLAYMYSGCIDRKIIDYNFVSKLDEAAIKYELPGLRRKCHMFLKDFESE